ncbi:hypothetical protein VNO77_23686 [Canavalia gladiata]|uniref:Uncharacterized protein n=1 Tax=Canavalia gladiata TaxID=3824 RepID=A0AAN9L660_CANGL
MHVHTRGIKIVRGEIVLLLRMNPPSLLDFSILIRTVELASESLYNPNRIFSRNLDTESQIMERGRKDAKDAKKRMRRKERKATRFTYLNQQETLVKQKRRRRK